MTEQEILDFIKEQKLKNDSYKHMAKVIGLSEEEVRKIGKPFSWRPRNYIGSSQDLINSQKNLELNPELVEKIKHMKQVARLPYWEIAKKSNIPEEQVRNLYKPYKKFPKMGSKPAIMRKKPITLQYNIIERFLKGTELENFWQKYKAHTKTIGGLNRETILKQPVTQEDLELLKVYVTQFEKPAREIAEERNISIGSLYTKTFRIAIKIVAQNPQILDSVKTEG